MKKKFLSMVIVATMLFSLAACGNSNTAATSDTTDTTTEVTTETEVAENTENTTETKTSNKKKSTKQNDKTTEEQNATEERASNGRTTTNNNSSNRNTGSQTTTQAPATTTEAPAPARQPSTQATAPAVQPSTTEAPAQTCNHDWREITRTVHHDAVYETVVVREAVWQNYYCWDCGTFCYDIGVHMDETGCAGNWSGVAYGTHLLEPEVTEQRLVRAAYDEEVGTGTYECTRCHARK